MKKLFEKKTRIEKLKKILFFYVVLFSFFYILYFSIYFFIFVSFIIFVKLAFYNLSKIIEIGWNKDFITFTKIVNGLTYGTIFLMSIFIFHAFGEFGILLYLVGYLYVEKNILIIKRQKTEKYEQCLVALFASTVNFLIYNFFMYLWLNPLDVVLIFYCKIVLLILLLLSSYFFIIEFKKCYNLVDILVFCRKYPGYALTLFISVARMVSAIIVEVVCMRYGIAGGMLVMGGPGVIPSGNGKPPSTEELSPEELAELEKQLRNNSKVVEQYRVIVPYENTLPEIPSQDENKFLEDVVNNLEAFKGMEKKQYTLYQKQYSRYREKNPDLSVFFHEDFHEFLSCIRAMIVNSSDENGKVNAVACPVNGGKKIDYIINSVGYQSKVVGQLSAGDVFLNRRKYGVYIEAFDTINFCNQIVYTQQVNPAQMKTCVQENPEYLRGQEALKENTYPQVTSSWFIDYFEYLSKNSKELREIQERMRKDGHISLITAPGKKASIEEITIPKSPDRPGQPKIVTVVSVSKVIKKILK